MNMLVCSEGRERTIVEYSKMLFQAGFKNVEAVRTSVMELAVVDGSGSGHRSVPQHVADLATDPSPPSKESSALFKFFAEVTQ